MKYFILGSFSSAFLLYGIALIYGATSTAGQDSPGTTNIARNRRDRDSRDGAISRAAVRRRRDDARRFWFQDRHRAFSHLDARRLRRRAHSGHCVHGCRSESGRLCFVHSRFCFRFAICSFRFERDSW